MNISLCLLNSIDPQAHIIEKINAPKGVTE